MKKTLLILVYSIFASNCMAEIRTNTDSTLVNNTVNSMVKVEGMLKDGDYSKEQKDEIRKKVLTTSIMVGDFYIGMLKRTCKKDIQLLCSKTKGAKLADCLNNNRTKVNEFKCFNYIEHVFGASPIEKNFNFRGLEIPAGSLVSFKTATKEWPTRVKLSKPTVYRGITFSDESYLQIRPKVYYFKGRKIISDDAFIIKSGGVIGDFTAAGIKYKANERHAAFEKDGCLKYGNVAEDTKIDDITIPAGSYLHLSRAGEIFNIRLSKDSTIRGQHIVAGRNIGFNSNNNMVIRLDEPYDNPLKEITIDGIKYINFVAINKQGKVARGVLANPTRINNKLYPDYTLITVNKNGEVIRSSQMERPAKELKVGDKVKNPNYLFAIEAKSRFYSQDAFEEKDLLKFLSISNLIHSSGLPTKGVKIKQVFLPGSEFTITDLKSKSIGPHTTSEMILVDNQGNKFYDYALNNKVFNDLNGGKNDCAQWERILDYCIKHNNGKNCKVRLKSHLNDESGKYIFDRKILAQDKFKYPYSEGVVKGSQKKLVTYLNEKGIKYKSPDKNNLYIDVTANLEDIVHMMLNYEDLDLSRSNTFILLR